MTSVPEMTSPISAQQSACLTLDGARRVITATEAEAKRLNAPGFVIAVVDDGGNLMAFGTPGCHVFRGSKYIHRKSANCGDVQKANTFF